VEQNLRVLFERALDDEPVPPPGDPARVAMAQGRRIRRRHGLLAAGAAATGVAAAALAVTIAWAPAAPPPAGVSAGADPACTVPAQDRTSDVSIFLAQDITVSQRFAVWAALQADPVVRDLRWESRAEAFARFKQLWRDDPDFVASVSADSLPDSFRMTLADPSAYPALAAKFRSQAGVLNVVVGVCPGAGR
jgi:hypothetical protein